MSHLPNFSQYEVTQALWSATRFFLSSLPNKVRQDYFLALFFYKAMCDEWREAQANGQACRWQIPEGAHFDTLFASMHKKGLGLRIDQALLALEKAQPDKLKNMFGDLVFDYSPIFAPFDSDVLLQSVLNALAQSELSMRPSRFADPGQIGQCFSALIEKFMCEFRPAPLLCPTPIAVAQLMATLLAPEPDDIIYDPACGTGALLVACAQWVQHRFARRECRLLGQDFSHDALRLGRMQLLLQRMDNHSLLHGDTLSNPMHANMIQEQMILPQVDIAVCHPPEMLPEHWLTQLAATPSAEATLNMPLDESASLAFVLHMLDCLKPDTGRMGAVLPRSIFGDGEHDQGILRMLLEANCMEGVICLPRWLFAHPEQPQVMMLLRRNRQNNKLCWLDASGIAADNATTFNRLPDFYRLGRDVPGYVRMVTHHDIKASGYRWDFQP